MSRRLNNDPISPIASDMFIKAKETVENIAIAINNDSQTKGMTSEQLNNILGIIDTLTYSLYEERRQYAREIAEARNIMGEDLYDELRLRLAGIKNGLIEPCYENFLRDQADLTAKRMVGDVHWTQLGENELFEIRRNQYFGDNDKTNRRKEPMPESEQVRLQH